jgi:hypothetical protein
LLRELFARFARALAVAVLFGLDDKRTRHDFDIFEADLFKSIFDLSFYYSPRSARRLPEWSLARLTPPG